MINGIKRSLKKYSGLIIVVIVGLIAYKAINEVNFDNIVNDIISLMQPFIYGIIIAYILNPIVGFFERRVMSKIKFFENRKKLAKSLSMLITYLLVAALVCFVIVSIIPQIVSSIQGIVSYLFTSLPKLERSLSSALSNHEVSGDGLNELIKTLNDTLQSVFDAILNSIKYVPNLMGTVVTGTFNVASWLLTFVIGIIISLYMLLEKNNLIALCKKFLLACLPESWYKAVKNFVKDINKAFESFFISKAVDSIIIGVIFFVGCCFISPDYALLFACVIGITNMIPYFGPFIGGIPVILLCLLQDPYSAIWMTIFVLVLQQFDGYILGPRVLGDSIGIKPLGVIFAILVGGGLFGVLGMFFGVPIFAVISRTITNILDAAAAKKENKLAEPLTLENSEETKDENP